VALQLRKFGIRHVRPLLGGFYEWKELGFPLVEIAPPGQEAAVSAGQIAAQGPG
jgi:3-mercaptopyruvate sulfurtransferase SseA